MLLLASVALATPFEQTLEHPVGWTVDRDEVDRLLEEMSGYAPPGTTELVLKAEGPDGVIRHIGAYFPPVPRIPEKAGRRSMPVDHPGTWDGWLANKAVYLSQCHGYHWVGYFTTQRGVWHDTVEDFHNPEGANIWLTAYLENAGANVFPVKERDLSRHAAHVDNGEVGYTEGGSGFANGPAGWAPRGVWRYDENPFELGTSRTFPANGGAKATWTPDVPEDGYYAVYVSWQYSASNVADAHYKIKHPGGVIHRYFDQRVHEATWQYVDQLWLPEGSGGLVVELIGDSASSGTLSADAVRIGGGMSQIDRGGTTTGQPRWTDGSILGIQYNGGPRSIYDPYWSGDGSEPSSRSLWAAWEHPQGEDAIYLSWHSNATESHTARGTVTYYAGNACSSGTPAVTGSGELAGLVQDEMMDSFKLFWDTDWLDRGTATSCFSEVDPDLNPEMPAALVELAFHDQADDAFFLKEPWFRRDAARAMYRGIVRYFAERDGQVPRFLPEPPIDVQLIHDADGDLRARWQAGPAGAPWGDAADSYVVYTSKDGYSWNNGFAVTGTSSKIDADDGDLVFVKVAGVNAGGISFPSQVVGARKAHWGGAPILVVDAFDRLDGGLLITADAGPTLGNVDRLDLRAINSFDTIVPHGRSIAAADWYFESASDEAFATLDLSRYELIVWAVGEESTVDETFDAQQQATFRDFVMGGGKLWTSGAEILWDLDERGDASDQLFAAEILGAEMEADAAGSREVDGDGVLAGISMDFGMGNGGKYPVEWPDTLKSNRTIIARYTTGETAAVLGEGVALFGFPFETIVEEDDRDALVEALLPALLPDWEEPDSIAGDDDDDDDDDDGPGTDSVQPGARSDRVLLSELRGCGCRAVNGMGFAGYWLGLVGVMGLRRRT